MLCVAFVLVWEDFSNEGAMTKEVFLALKTSRPPQLGYVGALNESGDRDGHGTFAEKIGKIYQIYEGQWENNVRCGDGKKQFASGDGMHLFSVSSLSYWSDLTPSI